MSITKHKLLFDPTEADDYDAVKSFLSSADGTLLTKTTTGGKEALDVHIAGSDIQLEVDLVHTEDSVRLGDGTDFFTSTTENGDTALDVHISNTSIVVTATDLDIRDLAFATDSVDVSGSEVSLDAATLAALESVTVSATDLDIRDLAFATDSVDVSGSEVSLDAATLAALESVTVSATDLDIRDLDSSQDSIEIATAAGQALAIESDGSLNVNSSEVGYSTCSNASVTIANTATDVVVTELALRKELTLQNVGSKDVYIGCDSSVTSTNGILVPKGATASFKFGPAINVHAITPSGTSELRILELA